MIFRVSRISAAVALFRFVLKFMSLAGVPTSHFITSLFMRFYLSADGDEEDRGRSVRQSSTSTAIPFDDIISAHLDTPRSFELLDRASGHRLGNIGSEVVDHKEAFFREE